LADFIVFYLKEKLEKLPFFQLRSSFSKSEKKKTTTSKAFTSYCKVLINVLHDEGIAS